MRLIFSCLTFGAAFSANQSASEFVEGDVAACVKSCHNKGYTCKAVTNDKNGGSSYGHPSCAMGCFMGSYRTTAKECKHDCNAHDGVCYWTFRAAQMLTCAGDDTCPGQNRRSATNKECEIGCDLVGPYLGTNSEDSAKQDLQLKNGPNFNIKDALSVANKFRQTHGKKPMTWRSDKKSCADKVAVYDATHSGSHPGGSVYNCGGAAGDFFASDYVDAINRVIRSAKEEGCPDCSCGHCSALLDHSSIVIGYDNTNFYANVRYYDKSSAVESAVDPANTAASIAV